MCHCVQFVAGMVDFESASGRRIGFIMLVIGRVLAGLGGGGATVVVPMFLGEIADRKVCAGGGGWEQRVSASSSPYVFSALALPWYLESCWGQDSLVRIPCCLPL